MPILTPAAACPSLGLVALILDTLGWPREPGWSKGDASIHYPSICSLPRAVVVKKRSWAAVLLFSGLHSWRE